MAKLLTFMPNTKKEISEKINLFTEIKQIQALHCNTITPADVDYTLKKLKERRNGNGR